MALPRFCIVVSILLMSILVIIVSASDEYEINEQNLDLHTNTEEIKEKLNYEQIIIIKPERKQMVDIKKQKIEETISKNKQDKEDNILTKNIYEAPKPNFELPIRSIRVQGLVYCKSGLKYSPLPGAVARITCVGVHKQSYKTTHFSVLSEPCNSKGYFYAIISPETVMGQQWKVKECKAYLDHSPLESSCKVPTNVNNGISGDLFASNYDTLSNYDLSTIKLSSVGPFFFTSVDQSYNKPVLNWQWDTKFRSRLENMIKKMSDITKLK